MSRIDPLSETDPKVLEDAINAHMREWQENGFPHPDSPDIQTGHLGNAAQLYGLTQLLIDKEIITQEEINVAKMQWYLKEMYIVYDQNIEAARRAKMGLPPQATLRPILDQHGNPLNGHP
jgi:hypothetical protein